MVMPAGADASRNAVLAWYAVAHLRGLLASGVALDVGPSGGGCGWA